MATKKPNTVLQAGLDALTTKERTQDLAQGIVGSTDNAITLVGLGGYIGAVGYHGNGKILFHELGKEKRFFKFALAMLGLTWTINNLLSSDLQNIAKTFLWLGLITSADEKGQLFDKINNYFNKR